MNTTPDLKDDCDACQTHVFHNFVSNCEESENALAYWCKVNIAVNSFNQSLVYLILGALYWFNIDILVVFVSWIDFYDFLAKFIHSGHKFLPRSLL